MSDKRRAEIEAKRAKLAELRKARADRQRAETERRQSEVSLRLSLSLVASHPRPPRLAHPLPRVAMSTTSSMPSSGETGEALTVPAMLRPRRHCLARRLVNPHCSTQVRLYHPLAVSADKAT